MILQIIFDIYYYYNKKNIKQIISKFIAVN